MTPELLPEGDAAARDELRMLLRAFNDGVSDAHRTIRATGRAPFEIVLRDEAGALAGGIAADAFWGWMAVDVLWVAEGSRGRGWGSQLLRLAEEEALRRGCTRAHLTTYSFQAREFYERAGYTVVGQLDDYPPGETFYWMRKDLGPDG